MNKILFALLFCVATAFAASAQPVADSTAVAPADSVAEMSAPQETCGEFKSEIAHRDSLMAVADSSCSVEKDSLRAALNSEQAKTKNWEQSYETMKKSNETCARALSVSIEANEKSKEKEKQSKSQAAMTTSSSFFGGIALGMLLFWLIFD
ncbi:MAG: hypothetical protein IKJ76_11510 [Fibrobacter sp.]|nr:hypothetical protein [Fibrobacter sp.]